MFADNKTFFDNLCSENPRSINNVKSDQLRKVDPAKNLLMQVSKNFFDRSEASISYQTNKY